MRKKPSQDKRNHIVKIINEICIEQNIQCTAFSYDWMFKLRNGERKAFIFGYDFGINSSAVSKICEDKSATSDILLDAKVPVVEHELFLSPTNTNYVGKSNNWERMVELLRKHSKVVCKDNTGSGGNAVYLVENLFQLEEAVHKLLTQTRSMSISPYYDIIKEYRAITLDYDVKLLYSKSIPCIIGDGQSTIHELLLNYMKENNCLVDIKLEDDALLSVLPCGEEYRLGWKFNLAKGATPTILDDCDIKDELADLAKKAAKALSVRFASVDMIETSKGEFFILEINSGIMMGNFIQAENGSNNYAIAKEIYKQAIDTVLGDS